MSKYTDLGFANYREYIVSDLFQRVKQKIRSKYPKSTYCWICDSYTGLNLHHEIYANFGKERLFQEVYWICDERANYCHLKIHFDENGEKIPIKTEFLRERRLQLRREYIHSQIKATGVIRLVLRLMYRVCW